MKEIHFLRLITVVSILIPLTVGVIFWYPRDESEGIKALYSLPAFHAWLNGTSFFILLLGYYFIINRQILRHRTCMLLAAGLSAIFLVSYIIYHSSVPQAKFGGEGSIRYFYFTLLISHIILAAIIVPFILLSLYRGLSGNYPAHKKVSRWTLPLWLYVSSTGVIVYLMMSPYYPS